MALADAISAVEYFIDSLGGQSAGAAEAVALAEDSIQHLLNLVLASSLTI